MSSIIGFLSLISISAFAETQYLTSFSLYKTTDGKEQLLTSSSAVLLNNGEITPIFASTATTSLEYDKSFRANEVQEVQDKLSATI